MTNNPHASFIHIKTIVVQTKELPQFSILNETSNSLGLGDMVTS